MLKSQFFTLEYTAARTFDRQQKFMVAGLAIQDGDVLFGQILGFWMMGSSLMRTIVSWGIEFPTGWVDLAKS